MFSQPAHLHEQIHRTDLPLWHQLETIAQSSDSRAIISAKYELPEPKTHTHTHTRISSLGCSERYINLSNKQLNHLPLSMQCGCLLAITDDDGRKDEDLGPKARMSNGWLTGWPELEPNLSPKEDDRQMGKLE